MKTVLKKIFIIVIIALFAQGCSTASKKNKTKSKNNIEKLGNFDKVYIPNNAPLISHMISIVQPELEINQRNKIANDIHLAISKYKVEPQIMVALIDTESDFKYDKVSTTGDLSLAQVNVEVWNSEFKRMKEPLIDTEKLTSEDQAYAMEIMAQILSILKKRHMEKDRRWYARYHSNTKKYKTDYLRKIELRMKLLSDSRILTDMTNVALNEINRRSTTNRN